MRLRHGELVLADLNPRNGTEPGKMRPVLVIQSDLLNDVGHPSTWVVPCTTQCIGANVLRVALPAHTAGNPQNSELMVDQSRAIDNRRIVRVLGALPADLLREVKQKLRQLGQLD